jgi:glutamate synthase domain-containing protein 2
MTVMQRIFWLVAAVGLVLVIVCPSPWIAIPWLVFIVIGLHDLTLSSHTLCRLYPVAAHMRFLLEFIRPEIQQYFIAGNTEERPFNRAERSLVYQRAKGERDTVPFGTEMDIRDTGFLTVQHSMHPVTVSPEFERVKVGGPDCRQPYESSRLNISAMSFGALSANAIRALNKGASLGGFAHNTGEGSISPYHKESGGDLIWQIGTAYFGCRTESGRLDPGLFAELANDDQVKMIEIKISQGAKPSHGGLLPAAKINDEIARVRGIPVGVDCRSPAGHPEFDDPRGLLEFVARLRELSGGKPVGFKLCIGIRSEFMGICKAMLETGITPDFITVDGAEGGTGAAPMEFTNRLGTPCNEGVDFVYNCLRGCGLRNRIRIFASGHTPSSFGMLVKTSLGADVICAARTMMLAMGCIQSRSCNTNHCPTGIATQDPVRSRALDVDEKGQRVFNFHKATVHSFFDLVGAMGLENPCELSPHHIFRRIDDETTKTFDEIYVPLHEGELLGADINPLYAVDWAQASPEHFKQICLINNS